MTLEELERATEQDLRIKANECFARGAAVEAQFYLDEIRRKRDDRTSRRDLILELVIIGLIGWEIWLGYQSGREADKQLQVLSNLQASSQATASALENVTHTTEAMSLAVQKQLSLATAVHLNVAFDTGMMRIAVSNASINDIALWGERMDGYPRSIASAPIWIAPAGFYNIPEEPLFKLFAAQKPGSPERTVNWEAYCRNQDGLPYIVKVVFIGSVSERQGVTVRTQMKSIVQEEWSR